MQKLQIDHVTEYHFASGVQLLPHRLLLRPRESHAVRIISSKLEIFPFPTIRWERDALDNSVAVASFIGSTSLLRIASQVNVEHYDETPLDFHVAQSASNYPFGYETEERSLLAPMLAPAWPNDQMQVAAWLRDSSLASARVETFALLDQLNRRISQDIGYRARDEMGVQPPSTTLSLRTGSCRDLAALFLDACRSLGLASRFVSGYHTSRAGESGAGTTHAWTEVYIPGPGWKGFDPTAGVVTGSEHVAVAVARHPEAVPPVAGSFVGATSATPVLNVSVRVVPA